MTILAVETSCDETAAAVIEREEAAPFATIRQSVVASQAKLHEKYGGVYPEVASREHVRQVLPVIAEALGLAPPKGGRLPHFALKGIDRLAVTNGPGLVGSLLVGTQTVATISLATGLPLVAVNHLAGHIYASFIARPEGGQPPCFPLLALVVSGGHTLLVRMAGHHHYQLLGQTRDDAAGEAFDKVAKLLGLPYPGGPPLSRLATRGDREAYSFPIALEGEDCLDFSFSGLKTAVLRQIAAEPKPLTLARKANLAAAFERAIVDALLSRVNQALEAFPVKDFVLGGGVAANRYMRSRLTAMLAHHTPAVTLHIPPSELCTDNAAVIGAAASFGHLPPIASAAIQTYARLPLG